MKRWKAILGKVLDLFFPPACMVCGQRIEDQGYVLCSDCEAKVSLMQGDLCPVCGTEKMGAECQLCAQEKFVFDSSHSIFRFHTTVKELIHELKYNGYVSPAGYFALPMAEYIHSDAKLRDFDMICPVPLHRVRRRERGYNQSELIAYAVSVLADVPYAQPVVRKINTFSQTRLSKAKRQKNLSGAFTVRDKAAVQGKKVILVDDVFTTGTTLNEIAKELRSAGAAKIATVTVARA